MFKKSQVSVEMMFAISLILTFFIFVVFYSEKEQKVIDNLKDYLDERRLCTKLSGVITKTFLMGDGTSFELAVTHKMEVNFEEHYVQVFGKLYESQSNTPVVFEDYPGEKLILEPGQKIRIENVNNKISISTI